ncbi:MAG: DEAD/DEAH box helicase family protein [Candidatus Heimdallarchaeota archaeon]|nr:DEAD/DEAH box helicase family protein [Candidatus Heimdallarchaeota archaeon]
MAMSEQDLMRKVLKERNSTVLSKWLYPGHPKIQTLTPDQLELIRIITFGEFKQVIVSWPTRSGKTWGASVGVSNFLAMNENKRIVFIGPEQSQANTLRDNMADLITSSPYLQKLLAFKVTGADKLKTEVSKKRVTFPSSNVEYEIYSAHGGASRLMGKGADGIMVLDERDLIEPEAEAKISRMRGDNPEETMILELLNPWGFSETARRHWDEATPYEEMKKLPMDHPDRTWEWCKFQMGWEKAVSMGRLSHHFIMQEMKERTPLEFRVLYESRFPDESEDQLIPREKIKRSEDSKFTLEEDLLTIERRLMVKNIPSKERDELNQGLKQYSRIISCDPADKGMDWSIIFWGVRKLNQWQIVGHYAEAKSDQMQLAGRIAGLAKRFIGRRVQGFINIDGHGLGVGSLSRLEELKYEWQLNNISIVKCMNGGRPMDKDQYVIARDENYYRLAQFFNDESIDIPKLPKTLRMQLISIRWDPTSGDRRKIRSKQKGEKSPDWADALMYFIWKSKASFYYTFGAKPK